MFSPPSMAGTCYPGKAATTLGLLLFSALANGCSDEIVSPVGEPASLSLSTTVLEIFETELRTISATVRDGEARVVSATVVWSSANSTVATVDAAGTVLGVGAGTTMVEAQVAGIRETVDVQVLTPMDFAFPLVGTLNDDFFYVNYVDLDPTLGISDYRCGLKSYDGHRGNDITLPSLVRMDQGVTVLAAAPGTVTSVTDGLPDRSTTRGSGGFGNHVRIAHAAGWESIYGHMATNSIAVSVGQTVGAGAALGLVGSSGNSSMPHLHMEFQRNGTVVDAFGGPCGRGVNHWAVPVPYQDTRRLIQYATTPEDLTLDLVKAPTPNVTTFSTADGRVYFWVHMLNLAEGSVSRFDYYDPSGALFWTYSVAHDQFYSMSWWWVWHSIAGSMTATGTWRIDYFNASDLVAQHWFELQAAPAGGPEAVPPSPSARFGSGGGSVGPVPGRR